MRRLITLILVALTVLISTGTAFGANETVKVPETGNWSAEQTQYKQELLTRINELEMRVNSINSNYVNRGNSDPSIGLVLFLFGGFCALWAQNSGRNPLGWFIGGAIFNFIAVLFVLKLNFEDKNPPQGAL